MGIGELTQNAVGRQLLWRRFIAFAAGVVCGISWNALRENPSDSDEEFVQDLGTPARIAPAESQITVDLGEIIAWLQIITDAPFETFPDLWESVADLPHSDSRRAVLATLWGERAALEGKKCLSQSQHAHAPRDLLRILAAWGRANADEMLTAVKDFKPPSSEAGNFLVEATTAELVNSDPEQVIALIGDAIEVVSPGGTVFLDPAKQNLLRAAYAELFERDRDSLLATVESLPGLLRQEAIKGIGEAWAAKESAAATAWAQGLADTWLQTLAMNTVIGAIGQHDPAAVVDQIRDLSRAFEKTTSMTGAGSAIFDSMFKVDPNAAIEWLGQFPLEHWFAGGGDGVRSALQDLVRVSPASTVDALVKLNELADSENADVASKALRYVGILGYEQALLTNIDQLEDKPLAQSLRESVIHSFARNDISAAHAYVSALPEEECSPYLWKSLGDVYSRYAPDSPEAWELRHYNEDAGYTDKLLESLANRHPTGEWAWEIRELLTDQDQQRSFTNELLRNLAITDTEAAAARLEQLTGDPGYHSFVGSIAHGWSENDPELAMKWIADTNAQEGIAAVAGQLSDVPESALEWLQSLSIDNAQASEAGSELFRRWMRNDFNSAIAAIENLPPGPLRDSGYQAAITDTSIARVTPEWALKLADAIADPAIRELALKRINEYRPPATIQLEALAPETSALQEE